MLKIYLNSVQCTILLKNGNILIRKSIHIINLKKKNVNGIFSSFFGSTKLNL